MSNYETTDFGLATALITEGFPVLEIMGNPGGRRFITFEDTEELQKAVKDYWNGDLLQDAQQFFMNQKGLKSRILNQ